MSDYEVPESYKEFVIGHPDWMFAIGNPKDWIGEEHMTKPPLGIKPRYWHEEERREELKAAIRRYMDANKSIPMEWVNEYNDLMKRESP